MSTIAQAQTPAPTNWLYDPKVRGTAYQVGLALIVLLLFYGAASNAVENLRAAKISSGFGFLNATSGFDVNQTLVPYGATYTYGRAFTVGLLNTLLVSIIGIVLATFLGFSLGVARLSPNWLVRKLATIYVETIRNIPLLLQLLFWYIAVLRPLPDARNSVDFGAGIFLNNRGLFAPRPIMDGDAWYVLGAIGVGIVLAFAFARWARRQQIRSGHQYPVGWTALGLIIGVPAVTWILIGLAVGDPIVFDVPVQQRFNLRGGFQIFPEFVALTLGLVIYTAAFIGEIVRAGILAVSKGQSEAAHALGVRPGPTLKLVVIPQAMRVIIPPLTSQYLNLTKNSSLAVAIGYPDLVQVFMGTVLNQTGQAIECVFITMAVYLAISLVTSAIMNDFNRRKALVER